MNTKRLVLYALLAAITIIMGLTPLGFLRIGLLEITFLSVPVIIAAITLGAPGGAVIGAVFGIMSFFQGFSSPFGQTLMSINMIFYTVLCIGTRVLMGLLTGLIFKALEKKEKIKFIIPSICAPILNTSLFMSALFIFYGRSDYIMGLRGGMGLLSFAAAFVGAQGLLEALVCAILGSAIGIAVYKVLEKAH